MCVSCRSLLTQHPVIKHRQGKESVLKPRALLFPLGLTSLLPTSPPLCCAPPYIKNVASQWHFLYQTGPTSGVRAGAGGGGAWTPCQSPSVSPRRYKKDSRHLRLGWTDKLGTAALCAVEVSRVTVLIMNTDKETHGARGPLPRHTPQAIRVPLWPSLGCVVRPF